MKNLLLSILLLSILVACGDFDVETKKPKISVDSKTVKVKLTNIPDAGLEQTVYIFTLDSKDSIYSTERSVAFEDTSVVILPPPGISSFTIIAFIPTGDDWDMTDPFVSGYYAAITGATNRTGAYIVTSWDNADSYETSSQTGASLALDVALTIDGGSTKKTYTTSGAIISLAASVTSVDDVESVGFYLNGDLIQELNAPTYAIDLNAQGLADGTYLVSVVVVDENGSEATDELAFVIDTEVNNSAPTISLSGITNGNTYVRNEGDTLTLVATVSDPDGAGDISGVDFTIANDLRTTVTSSPYQYKWALVSTPAGSVTVKVTVKDQAGEERSAYANVTLEDPVL
ncbi:Ig-like domain-containing protein [Marinoscillum sp. MHG1-6]|uniref:Ig-like domain-containing protein n=1 Tax=Marinoscillum sp. MHG1-6 TaxID=2959627 RepID=UPI0021570083|nr:Ig-like domain-containing protein [Marinoscillum sp. MHG1-6]